MKALSNVHNWIVKSFLILCPYGLVFIILINIPSVEEIIFANKFWTPIIVTPFGIWLLSSQYILLFLIVSKKFRESILMKMAFIKERDERESLIVGRAAKSTYLLTLGISIFLISISTMRYDITFDKDEQIHGKVTIGTIDLTHARLESYRIKDDTSAGFTNQALSKIPISNTALLALLLVIQVVAFHYFSKKSKQEI